MRAGQPMTGNHKFSIAGYTLRGIPAGGGDEAVEDDWFQRGAGRRQRMDCFAESMPGQQAAG